ncbi:hypothetical protein GGG16DRAFT_106057 [Schizophyllum commune]
MNFLFMIILWGTVGVVLAASLKQSYGDNHTPAEKTIRNSDHEGAAAARFWASEDLYDDGEIRLAYTERWEENKTGPKPEIADQYASRMMSGYRTRVQHVHSAERALSPVAKVGLSVLSD